MFSMYVVASLRYEHIIYIQCKNVKINVMVKQTIDVYSLSIQCPKVKKQGYTCHDKIIKKVFM